MSINANVSDIPLEVKITIRKSSQKNIFYVHYIYVKNNIGTTFAGVQLKNSKTAFSSDIDNTVTQNDNNVNNSFVQNQDRQIYSDSFKEWFGDWEKDPENASKVVDGDGKPLVVGIDINRAYQLQNIEKSSVSVRVHNINASSVDLTDDIHTVSDLYSSVNQHDRHFNPISASKVVDEDGKPLVVYHGIEADFTVFGCPFCFI